jgi:hypothetical protein
MIDRLLTIRKKQLKIFEDLTMFEQRILCHKLPNSCNSITINDIKEQCVNKHNKMVQDLKRQMLNAELEQYELKIQHYEHLYEQELATFQSERTGAHKITNRPMGLFQANPASLYTR